jgi:hypothetical protein
MTDWTERDDLGFPQKLSGAAVPTSILLGGNPQPEEGVKFILDAENKKYNISKDYIWENGEILGVCFQQVRNPLATIDNTQNHNPFTTVDNTQPRYPFTDKGICNKLCIYY